MGRAGLAARRRGGLEPLGVTGHVSRTARSAAGDRPAQAAGPVGGGHAALARRLDVAEADRAGSRCRPDGVAVDVQLAGREVRRRSPGRQGDRAELEPGAVEFGPGARVGGARADLPVDHVRGQLPVHPRVVRVILGAKLTPSAGCGRPGACRPRSRPGSRPAGPRPDAASRPSRSPVVSSGRIGSVSTPYTGPASSSLTIRNVVAPVMSSPCSMACWTGAAPRQAGSTEKCRLTQPCGGMSSAACGSSAPYAVDRAAVGPIARSRSRNSGSRARAGLEHLDARPPRRAGPPGWPRPCGRGRPARPGGSPPRRPRAGTPAGRPGRGPRSRAYPRRPAASDTAARPLRRCRWVVRRDLAPAGPGRPHHSASRIAFIASLRCFRVEPVDEQDAVQVVGLVLDAAGQQLGALERHRLAVHVEALGDHAPRRAWSGRPGRGSDRQPSSSSSSLLGQVQRRG